MVEDQCCKNAFLSHFGPVQRMARTTSLPDLTMEDIPANSHVASSRCHTSGSPVHLIPCYRSVTHWMDKPGDGQC